MRDTVARILKGITDEAGAALSNRAAGIVYKQFRVTGAFTAAGLIMTRHIASSGREKVRATNECKTSSGAFDTLNQRQNIGARTADALSWRRRCGKRLTQRNISPTDSFLHQAGYQPRSPRHG